MIPTCSNYEKCRLPVSKCNSTCKLKDESCHNCTQNEKSVCNINGKSITDNDMPCAFFEEAPF